jgi:hypothetical protein
VGRWVLLRARVALLDCPVAIDCHQSALFFAGSAKYKTFTVIIKHHPCCWRKHSSAGVGFTLRATPRHCPAFLARSVVADVLEFCLTAGGPLHRATTFFLPLTFDSIPCTCRTQIHTSYPRNTTTWCSQM